MSPDNDEDEVNEFDPAMRQPCPDGNCTGILDEQGECGECHGVWPGDARRGIHSGIERREFTEKTESHDDQVDDDHHDSDSDAEGDEHGDDSDEDSGPVDRVPCPDGSCIGILDATGACGVCGATEPTEEQTSEADSAPEKPVPEKPVPEKPVPEKPVPEKPADG